MKEQKITRMLRHDFSDEELKSAGLALSAAIREYEEVELRKKEVNRAFGEQLEDLRGRMRKLSAAIADRGEERLTECTVVFHKPTVAAKTVTRTDTGEKVAEEAMTAEECQEHLFEQGTSA